MSDDATVALGRRYVRQNFRWINGDADTWSMLREPDSLAAIVGALAALARRDHPDVLVGVESRGFALAPAVAIALGVGFAPVRKESTLFPGDVIRRSTGADYRGTRHRLSARRDLFAPGQRVVLVDDWIETGSQAATAAELVHDCGASLVGVVVIVDEARAEARKTLPPIRSLVVARELR